MSWTLVLHGGAGQMTRDTITPAQAEGARAGLGRALDAGAAILADGGAALDAVEAAVRGAVRSPSQSRPGAAARYQRDQSTWLL